MRTRNWPIRAKIISLLMVPLVTLIVMWLLATAVTLGPGLDLLDAQTNVDNVGRPAQALVAEVQVERKATLIYLATARRDPASLTAQRARTDAAVREFRRLAGGSAAEQSSGDLTARRLAELHANLDVLPRLRASVDRGELDRPTAMRRYTDIIDSSFLVFDALIRIADEGLTRESRALVAMARAREVLAQEDAIVSAALTAGSFTAGELGQTIQLIGTTRFLTSDTLAYLHATDRTEFERLASGDAFVRLAGLENQIVTGGEAGEEVPIDAGAWRSAYDAVSAALQDFELRAADRLVDRSRPAALLIFGRLALAALIGLVTVTITTIASVRIGRSLIRRLAGLRQAALELAVDRLPHVVARLRRGEDVDVAHEAPDLPYGEDEIGQVGHAFNEVQRTAVNSAVEEAELRRGLNEVFLNIARRSQTLLHRQLSILDRMERRADDPTELEDLFRVDHLATRMRRHAEDLVILAGAAPGRGWRNPVAIVDVLRGAVSEVEDYARVSIRPMPEVSLAGRAVGDVIHLLAELIENATSFSPPHTRVNVGGEVVANGFAVDIEDRGLGLSPEELTDLNRRLLEPPEFDPTNSAQLGLFVVARLAARHGVRVQLRSSPYGGITAVALIPDELITPGALPGAPHPREPLAALPSGPLGREPNGSRAARYRELSTAPRPAITASPPPAPAPPVAPRHARPEYIEATTDGLPRRIRQTSLAPQLRDDPPPAIIEDATQASASRSPEELRAMMSSFQAGTNRARSEVDTTEDDGMGGTPESNGT
jgi:hypothetical protein